MRTLRHNRKPDRLQSPGFDSLLGSQLYSGTLTAVRRYGWLATSVALAVFVLIPYFAAGDPPGVDAPSFLHFGWVFEQSLSGSGSSFLNDPWWYGGLPYLQAYSPGGYGAAGLLAAVTPLSIAGAFKLVVVVALVTTSLTTYWLGRTLGLRRVFSFLAAALFVTSYPVISGIGIFGWLPTLTSMPLAMGAYISVEKWAIRPERRVALLAGALLGLALIAHHMTAIAMGLAIAVRLAVYLRNDATTIRRTGLGVGWMTLAFAAISSWWAIPFLVNTVSVGFQRELAGNWEFNATTFAGAVFDRDTIGIETFPAYIGFVQGGLGILSIVYAVVNRTRLRGLAIAAAVLFWFSTGTSLNPLIRVYPLSGLDVSRFAFYVAPMFALLAAYVVQKLALHRSVPRHTAIPVLATALVLIVPIVDVVSARDTLRPVDEPDSVTVSIDWIGENIPAGEKVLAVGYRNWDGHWIPQRAGMPIMDGWYDEGASNWREIRDYRLMGWLADVDTDRLHEIMTGQETRYLVISDWDGSDSPLLFRHSVSGRPDLFESIEQQDGFTAYRIR